MKKLKLFFALFAMLALGVGNAWGADYSATHTSNVTFTAGTNGSTAKVTINSVGYDAMKLGTGSKTGTMTFKIPVGTTKIHLHVAGWKSNNTKLNLSANNGVTLGTTSITSTADNGVTSNSPFTLATPANATTSYYKVVEITSGATVAETTITIQTTSSGYRAVVWGVNAETIGGGETPETVTISLDQTELSLQAGATETLTATVTGSSESVTWTSSKTAVATVNSAGVITAVAAGEATITAAIGDVKATCAVTVTAATTPEEPGAGTSGGDKYTKVTTLDDLEDDAYYVLYGVSGNYTGALKNTVSSGRAGIQAVTITEDAITNPDAAIVWRLNGNSSGGWTLYNEKESKYIEIQKDNTSGFSLNESSSHTYTVTVSSEKGFFFKSNHTDAGSRGISIYQTDFRPYASSAAKTLYLFKKATETGGDEPGTGEPVPSLTADPTTIDFGTVYEGATVADKTVAVNFANLTGDVTYSGLSTPFSATGAISATGDKITISAKASTIGEYSQTLTVASTADSKTAEVTVKMNVVEKPAPTGTFTLHTGELIEGDYVIYYSGKAMKALLDTKNRLQYEEVTPTDNKIVDPLVATIWHIAPSGTNWTVYNENVSKYAAGTGTKSEADLVADLTGDNANKAAWTVTASDNAYEFENVWNKSKSVNANLRNNTTYGFACYATSTGGALSLYRKAGTKYNVTVNSTTNGKVTASPTSAEAGTTITLTVIPETGYVLDALTVTDASSKTIEVADNKFTMPASDVTVSATFKQDESGAVESNSTATIVFASNANQEDGSSLEITEQTEIGEVVAQGVEFISGFADVKKVYPNSVHGLKLGTGSAIGKITIGLNISKKVSKITFKTYQYKEKEATIKFSAGGKEGSTSEFGDYTLTFDEPTTVSQIVISTEQASKGRAYVSQIDIELAEDEAGEGGEDPVVPTPTVNPTTTFVFNTADGLAKLGIAYPTTADGTSKKTNIENNTTVISNGVGLTMTSGTTATRVWLTASGVLDLRVYKDATLTFAVADGFEIIKVDFEGSDLTNLAVDDNPMTDAIWEGNQKSVTFENQSNVVKINTIAITVTYTRDVTPGEYGTICLPYAVNNYTGATFYAVAGKEGNKIVFDEVTELEAGKPYIFMAEAAEIKLAQVGEAAIEAGNHNSLQGTFNQIDPAEDNILVGNYMVVNNIIKKCGINCGLKANRAYFDGSELGKLGKPGAQMPGRKRITMGTESENAATGTEDVVAPAGQTLKIIENGQLIIIRNGEKFNAQGMRL